MDTKDLRLEVMRLVTEPSTLLQRESIAEQDAAEGGFGRRDLQALHGRVLGLTVANYGQAILLLTEALAAQLDK